MCGTRVLLCHLVIFASEHRLVRRDLSSCDCFKICAYYAILRRGQQDDNAVPQFSLSRSTATFTFARHGKIHHGSLPLTSSLTLLQKSEFILFYTLQDKKHRSSLV